MTPTVIWPVIDLFKGENQFIGISMISALLERHGVRSEVVEADYNAVRDKIRRDAPLLLAFSTPTVYAKSYLDICRRLKKEFRFFSVFGGPHPTFFPEMIEEDGPDIICRGEGEMAMLELVQRILAGRPFHDIENLWIKQDGHIQRNPLRPLQENLDALPLPDHQIFRRALPHGIWQALVITGRGCPYQCTYCFNHVYRELYRGKGPLIRRRSVSHVLEELKEIKRLGGYRFIRFADDIFTLSPEWVEEFTVRYGREIRVPFSCLVRADHVTPKLASQLRSAGCYRIQMGIEAGDEVVRNQVFRRQMSEEDIIRAGRILKEAGLKLATGNIMGAPGSSLEKDFKTLRLNMLVKPAFAGVTFLQPYRGTRIHEYARELGMLDGPRPDLNKDTVGRISSLRFINASDKKAVENLQKLFFLPVQWPSTLPLVRRMVHWPFQRFYHFLFSVWVNYCLSFRLLPPGLGWRIFLKKAKAYHRIAAAWDKLARRQGMLRAGEDIDLPVPSRPRESD